MEIKIVNNKRDLRRFINLPARIHAGHQNWVPPLYQDDWKYFSVEQNKQAVDSDTIRLLALDGDRVVGRIMGIISHRVNRTQNQRGARFTALESTRDEEVVRSLIGYIEHWARGHGQEFLLGPKGFSNVDPVGLMVEGYENEPTLSTTFNFPYLVNYLQTMGFVKHIDYVAYKIPIEIPHFYHRIHQRIKRRAAYQLLEFASRRELKPHIVAVFELMNETYRHLDGYVPLDHAEMHSMARRFLPLLDPRFIKAVLRDGEIVAFVLGIPNLNAGIRKAGGRLFPTGIFHILRARANSPQLDLLLGAVREDMRGRGLDVLMGMAMYKSAQVYGFDHIDSHLELETNTKVRAEMERVGGEIYKRYRIFRKEL